MRRPTCTTLHLTPEAVWRLGAGNDWYEPETSAADGFVHCTDGGELLIEVANRYYQTDHRPYVVLDIDLARVAAPAIYEDEARRYPHIYGPIEREAILRVRRMERAPDGTFTAIGNDVP